MNRDQQDLSWACLPKEARNHIRSDYEYYLKRYEAVKANTASGAIDALEDLFGSHNLTSDTEPEEMLMVERKKVQEKWQRAYEQESNYAKAQDSPTTREEMYYNRGIMSIIDTLFGDKCLPDKELNEGNFAKSDTPNTPNSGELKPQSVDNETDKELGHGLEQTVQPSVQAEQFKLGDKVRVIDIEEYAGEVTEIIAVDKSDPIAPYKLDLLDDEGGGIWCDGDAIEPYTEPETKDMEEKELDIYELLQDCSDVTTIYSVVHDAEVDFKLSNGYIEFMGLSFYSNGSMYDVAGRCMLYPSRALYEKYPLDAYSAWMEWKEARKPKRWTPQIGEHIFWVNANLMVSQDRFCDFDAQRKRRAVGNEFKTGKEAQQAAEAVRECLEKFHKEHQ